MHMFDLCRSEIHMYINDICIKFPSRVTVAHSIPPHSFSIMFDLCLDLCRSEIHTYINDICIYL
jgi:hypothetical protein